jgi:N-carbamoyl-L-amino-acid hydrolase
VSARWQKDLVRLGQLGRPNRLPASRREELDASMGVFRLEGTSQMQESRQYIVERMEEAGLQVRFDRIGNLFGRMAGEEAGAPAVLSGSHLDSVRNGGMFDGTAGVVASLEAARILREERFVPRYPIEVCVFMGEEGSAVPEACVGSQVLAGLRDLQEALALKTAQGTPLGELLASSGHLGSLAPGLEGVGWFVELHIEQGPVLHSEGTEVGVVENIAGISYLEVTIRGQENHAGSTPMRLRRDALVGASRLIWACDREARALADASGGSAVATVDCCTVLPGAPSVIPGTVRLGIDIRDGSAKSIRALRLRIEAVLRQLEQEHGLQTTTQLVMDYPPVALDRGVIRVIESAASAAGVMARRMNSGAIHDAQSIAHRVKTGMIFVASVDGVSHSPLEWTEWNDLEKGIAVLTGTLKRLSKPVSKPGAGSEPAGSAEDQGEAH